MTIYRQVNHALEWACKSHIEIDALLYQRVLSQSKQTPTWSDSLFGQTLTGRLFVDICTDRLHTPVIRLAAQEIIDNNRGHGFVECVFQYSAPDAMALHAVLKEDATTQRT